jgi:hypothetical protein
MVAGAAFGYMIGKTLNLGKRVEESAIAVVLCMPLVLFLVLALHELGHVIGGWMSGFKLYLYAVGPLMIRRRGDRLTVSYNRSASLWGGVASTAPAADKIPAPADMRGIMVRVVAGGPTASVLGALALPAALLAERVPVLSTLSLFFGCVSLMIAMATLIPMTSGGFVSDGGRLLQLWRGGRAAERWGRLAAISGLSNSMRPRDWPTELVESVSEAGDRSYDGISGAWLRSMYHMDRGEMAEARVWLEESLADSECWPKAAQGLLHVNAAWFHALHGDGKEVARQHLELARRPGFVEKHQLHLAEAAVLLAEERKAEAIETARKGLGTLKDNLSGSEVAHREYLSWIIQQAS